jgi:hypothetical protein
MTEIGTPGGGLAPTTSVTIFAALLATSWAAAHIRLWHFASEAGEERTSGRSPAHGFWMKSAWILERTLQKVLEAIHSGTVMKFERPRQSFCGKQFVLLPQ